MKIQRSVPEEGVTCLTLSGDFDSFAGSNSFVSEDVIAGEIGYRTQPIEDVTIDLAAFYNHYDDLRSTEILGPPTPLPSPPFPLGSVVVPLASTTKSMPRPTASRSAPTGASRTGGRSRAGTR